MHGARPVLVYSCPESGFAWKLHAEGIIVPTYIDAGRCVIPFVPPPRGAQRLDLSAVYKDLVKGC